MHHVSTRGKNTTGLETREQCHYMWWEPRFPVKLPVMSFYYRLKSYVGLPKRADVCRPLKASENSSDQSSHMTPTYLLTWWTFIITNRGSAPPASHQQWTVICEWPGRNPLPHSVSTLQPCWVFFTNRESWVRQQGPERPCSELSRSCLNGILIVSCFCVVVFPPHSLLFSLWLCTHSPPARMPLLTFTPPLSNQVRLFPLQSAWWRWHLEQTGESQW